MTRALSEELLLFLVPFVLFALWLAVRRRTPFARVHWDGHVSWLVIAGLVVALGWLVCTGLTAQRGTGAYVPAHMENGVFVPGADRMNAPPAASAASARQLHRRPGRCRPCSALLDRDGEQARVVGGAVRNALLGLAPATSTSPPPPCPRSSRERARAAGIKAVPTGHRARHGDARARPARPSR